MKRDTLHTRRGREGGKPYRDAAMYVPHVYAHNFRCGTKKHTHTHTHTHMEKLTTTENTYTSHAHALERNNPAQKNTHRGWRARSSTRRPPGGPVGVAQRCCSGGGRGLFFGDLSEAFPLLFLLCPPLSLLCPPFCLVLLVQQANPLEPHSYLVLVLFVMLV